MQKTADNYSKTNDLIKSINKYKIIWLNTMYLNCTIFISLYLYICIEKFFSAEFHESLSTFLWPDNPICYEAFTVLLLLLARLGVLILAFYFRLTAARLNYQLPDVLFMAR